MDYPFKKLKDVSLNSTVCEFHYPQDDGSVRVERVDPREVQSIQKENEILRTALEYYAERNNWRSSDYDSDTKSQITISDLGCKSFNGENNFADYAIPSGGRRAREAIACVANGGEK